MTRFIKRKLILNETYDIFYSFFKVKSKLNEHNLYLKRTKLSSNMEYSFTNLFKVSHKTFFQHKANPSDDRCTQE
jgi:hypothetical protein